MTVHIPLLFSGGVLVCQRADYAAPSITSTPTTTATVSEEWTYQVTATTANAYDTLTYSAPTKPTGMTINASTGAIAWTPSEGQAGGNSVVVIVTNRYSQTDTQSFSISVGTSGTTHFEDDFESYANKDAMDNVWTMGSAADLSSDGGVSASKCALVAYAQAGTTPHILRYSVASLDLSEAYIRFYFRVDSPSGGCKFLKIFGKVDAPTGYADATFLLDYSTGTFFAMYYGDGATTTNDGQAQIRYGGYHSDASVSVDYSSATFNALDGEWHCFEAFWKYNTDDNRDGEVKVWFDGDLKLSASNIKNRHNSNSREIDLIGLADYCSELYFSSSWNIWYDDFVVADHYIGP